jgi:hypothetical protein
MQGGGEAGKNRDVLRATEILPLFDQSTVTVKEDSFVHSASGAYWSKGGKMEMLKRCGWIGWVNLKTAAKDN